ncbi:glycosyltransferase family 2 protein [Actinoplanes oblitus]|uniref:Glycosyltransferase family 2 protein n=1 Tax=Actinoplanes oblitus TaxID=3040509 RepID=A0ABY8W7J9_9ACTN|nr:glycosyltransferase family 2 protein [Actinoplanes oblitus]WIM93018.1 glycosyltransferase family 2 protein [Actinoplanes oblitus]
MPAERSIPPTVVVLPVYQPSSSLPEMVTALIAEGFDPARLVVVDDGSSPRAEPVLAEARLLGCVVLRHAVNQGKGVALKTAFRYAAATFPGSDVICADADGQHRAADVRLVAEHAGRGSIVLGVRDFGPMPPRSKLGNTLTRLLFRAATGRRVSDTQTGLRAYPAGLLDRLGRVPGERFEYEMNVLLDAARTGRPIEEIRIPATYLNGNASSHFGSLSDSVRVYRPLLQYAATSLLTRRAG